MFILGADLEVLLAGDGTVQRAMGVLLDAPIRALSGHYRPLEALRGP